MNGFAGQKLFLRVGADLISPNRILVGLILKPILVGLIRVE